MGINKGAVALQWDSEIDDAPRLIAAGKGVLADRILALAEQADIPIVVKEPLVDVIISLKPGTEIPPQMFRLTAEIYAFLSKIDRLSRIK